MRVWVEVWLWVSFGEGRRMILHVAAETEKREANVMPSVQGPAKNTTQTKARHATARTPSWERGGGD